MNHAIGYLSECITLEGDLYQKLSMMNPFLLSLYAYHLACSVLYFTSPIKKTKG